MSRKLWIPHIALRYLLTHNGHKGHLGNILAFLGLSIGIMTLLTVLTVMNGFQQGFITSINEVYSYHIRVEEPFREPGRLEGAGIIAAVPFRDEQGILSALGEFSCPASVRYLGMAQALEDRGFLNKMNLTEGHFPERAGDIIIGKSLARFLRVHSGDSLGFSTLNPRGGKFFHKDFRISGIFSTGYHEYDRNLAFTPLEPGGEEPRILGIKLKNHFRDRGALEKLRQKFPDASSLQSWRQYNSAFFNALKIEKIFMFLMLGLIFIVVAVNIFHSMKRNVRERLDELALIKALGGTGRDLNNIYFFQAFVLCFFSGMAGTFAGMGLSLNINEVIAFFLELRSWFHGVSVRMGLGAAGDFMPFYFMEIPVKVFWQDVVLINLSSFISVFLAVMSSVRKASQVLPAEIFTNE